MDDLGALTGMLTQVERMMQDQTTTEIVKKVVDMYDEYALEAFKALLKDDSSNPHIVKDAWKFADEMMAERKQRGLGGMSDK